MTYRLSPLTQHWRSGEGFALESGAALPHLELAYRTWGTLGKARDNAVFICHAFTGSADADVWWTPMIGKGLALDPTHDYIICSNVLGGCYGSSGPRTLDGEGRLWGARFPSVTIRDQVRAQIALLHALGVKCVRMVIGLSMGGLQAIEWPFLSDIPVRSVVSAVASARQSAWCLGWNEVQRQALASDPKFHAENYDPGDPPLKGLAAARAIAMLTYRAPESLARRFDNVAGDVKRGFHFRDPNDYAINGWLRYHGQALNDRFDAQTYRILLDAMDSHDVSRGRGTLRSALGTIDTPVLVLSISSDHLYVPEDQHLLARLLPCAHLETIHSVHGHDGLLIDADIAGERVRAFREDIGTLPGNELPADPPKRLRALSVVTV